MKAFKVSTLSLIGIIVLSLIIYASVKTYHNNDLSYQIDLLENGTAEQKVVAMNYMAEKKVSTSVPQLIEYVDNYETVTYKTKNPESLSCFSTTALEEITNASIGNSCCSSFDCRDKEKEISKQWQNWYIKEYKTWLVGRDTNQ